MTDIRALFEDVREALADLYGCADIRFGRDADRAKREANEALDKIEEAIPAAAWKGVYPGHCINPDDCRGLTHCPRRLSCVE